MKILILVLSYDSPPYSDLMKAQIQSWDKIENDNIYTIYYCGDTNFSEVRPENHNSEVLYTLKNDFYYYMASKFKATLLVADAYRNNFEYDFVFRTNSSSYVNKIELLKFAEKLPKEKCYVGWEIQGNAGYNIVSGAGIFLSPDTAEILRNNIDPNFEREEDVYIGQILSEHGIKIVDDKSRIDVDNYHSLECVPLDAYHYRIKSNDRLRDAETMKLLHQKIINQ